MSVSVISPCRMHAIERIMKPGGSFKKVAFSTNTGVIQRENGDVILIDAPFSKAELEAPFSHLPFFSAATIGLTSEGGPLIDRLHEANIAPDSVTHIIATHLHVDHIGAYVDLPNAEIVCSQREWESAQGLGPIKGYAHVERLKQSGRVSPRALQDGERHGFPNHCDLFGDGSVVLLDAKGHTPGSIAILATDVKEERQGLFAGDAAYSTKEYREASFSFLQKMVAFNRDWCKATWQSLQGAESEGMQIILAHDREAMELWPLK